MTMGKTFHQMRHDVHEKNLCKTLNPFTILVPSPLVTKPFSHHYLGHYTSTEPSA